MADGSDVERLGMLASALAGRPLVVALVGAGEPSWTDGKTVYVDPESSSRAQLESLAVQASLLASGGLGPDIIRRLGKRQGLGRFGPWQTLIRPASTRLRISRDGGESRTIDDPPPSFGVIRVRKLLEAQRVREKAVSSAARHVPRRQSDGDLVELPEDADTDHDSLDPFSSPVDGGGAIGKLRARLLGSVRGRPDQLSRVIGPLFRVALNRAEARRRKR